MADAAKPHADQSRACCGAPQWRSPCGFRVGQPASNTNFQAGVFDPQTGIVTTQPVGWDVSCNGMAILADGCAFIDGGPLRYDPFHSELRSAVYDSTTARLPRCRTWLTVAGIQR